MGIDTDAMRARLRSYRQSGFPNYCMALDELEALLSEIEAQREDAVVYRSVETSLTLQVEELQALTKRMREVRKSAVQAAVAEERAAIAAWLWSQSVATHDYEGSGNTASSVYVAAARAVQDIGYLRKEKP